MVYIIFDRKYFQIPTVHVETETFLKYSTSLHGIWSNESNIFLGIFTADARNDIDMCKVEIGRHGDV